MQFDWTTFVLEILNFLVLVWILKRFLYQPVLNVLDARQARVRDEIAQAERLREEGASLHQQYEERLADWSKEREARRQQLEQELTQQRTAGMERLRCTLADEEDKARMRGAAAAAAREAELVRQAAESAYGDASAMLRRLASPALTANIVALLVDDLAALPPAALTQLREAATGPGVARTADVAAAHPIDEAAAQAIAQALSAAAERPLQVTVRLDPGLIAGVRVALGECLLHANLADELAFFRRQDGRV